MESLPQRASQHLPHGTGPDFSLLPGGDEYSRYFDLVARACRLLLKCYRLVRSEDTYEAQRVQAYLGRLLSSVRALRMKYACTAGDRRMLWVDLTDSGFPNAEEIAALRTAVQHREERLRELPTRALLKQLMLDSLFRHETDPRDLMAQMAERSFLSMLGQDRLFLPFVTAPDDLEVSSSGVPEGIRQYRCSWGCYDFRTNRPYLHIMTFDQDLDEEPVEEGEGLSKLREVLEAEGSRTPDVAILAMAIDQALESVHPKIVKRIALGPLYTGMLLDLMDPDHKEDKHRRLADLLDRWGQEDDFILCIADEIVVSKRQEVTRTMFAPKGRVREVFHLPEADPECYRRRASVVHKYVLMPHAIAQHLRRKAKQQIPELRSARILTYDRRGAVHGR